MVSAALAALLGAAFLHAFYRGVQHKWPNSYYTLPASADPIVSRRLPRYLLFRFGPVYAVAVFVAVTMARLREAVVLSLALMLLLHIGTTNATSVLGQLRLRRSESFSLTAVVYNACAMVLIVLAGVLAVLTRRLWEPLIPQPKEVSTAIWTGLAAAVLASYVQHLTSGDRQLPDLLARARKDAGPALLKKVRDKAIVAGTDPLLLEAILLTEVLQRPRWLRTLEALKGRILSRGTYGVMQVRAPRPISDEESVDVTVDLYRGRKPEQKHGHASRSSVRALLAEHNRSSPFLDLAVRLYDELEQST